MWGIVSLVDFNFTATDNLDPTLYCNLTLDGSVHNAVPIFADNGTMTTYQVAGILDGMRYWNISCWDNASHINISETWYFNALIVPEIILISPQDNGWNNTQNLTFFYNVTDSSGLYNCSLIFESS